MAAAKQAKDLTQIAKDSQARYTSNRSTHSLFAWFEMKGTFSAIELDLRLIRLRGFWQVRQLKGS